MATQFNAKASGSVMSLVDRGLTEIPEAYIHPENERPTASPIYKENIPLIDLEGLHGFNRADTVNAISKACQDWGFFQVINHGISERVIEKMVAAHHRFLELPEVEKEKFIADDPRKPVMYGSSFTAKNEKFLNWRDFLTISIPRTIDPKAVECWPQLIRDAALEYTAEVKKLGLTLLSALSESLGVPDTLQNMLSEGLLLLNYYPTCPNPDMTFGVCAHSDAFLLTILLQDEVGGLQVSHQGRWIAVHPIPNALLINVGDTLQVPFFCSPANSAVIRPIPEILNEHNPPNYRSYVFGEYMTHFYNKPLAGKADNLAFAKLI